MSRPLAQLALALLLICVALPAAGDPPFAPATAGNLPGTMAPVSCTVAENQAGTCSPEIAGVRIVITDGATGSECGNAGDTGLGLFENFCRWSVVSDAWVIEGTGHPDGANCPAGEAAAGVDASGTAQGCTDYETSSEVSSAVSSGITTHAGAATAHHTPHADGANCPTGQAPLGVDAAGATQGCTDYETPAEVSTSVSSAVSTHAAASTAHHTPHADGGNCLTGQAPLGVDASGAVQGCTDYETSSEVSSAVSSAITTHAAIATAHQVPHADGANCPAGEGAAGVDASGAAQGCTDYETSSEVSSAVSSGITTHAGDVDAHHTPGEDGLPVGGSVGDLVENSSPGSGSWVDASTVTVGAATALAADGANCSAGEAPLGVDAAGAVQGCADYETSSEVSSAITTHAGVSAAHHTRSSITASDCSAASGTRGDVCTDSDDEKQYYCAAATCSGAGWDPLGTMIAGDTAIDGTATAEVLRASGDGLGARLELDVNTNVVSCGTTEAGTQACVYSKDDLASPRALLYYEVEGQTAILLQEKSVTLNMWDNLNITTTEVRGWSPPGFAGRWSPEKGEDLSSAPYHSVMPVPLGRVMIPIAFYAELRQNMGATNEDCTVYLRWSNDASGLDADLTCTDPRIDKSNCGDSTGMVPIFNVGADIYGNGLGADPLGTAGERGKLELVSLFAIERWWQIITYPRTQCTTSGNPCATDAYCDGIDSGDTCDLTPGGTVPGTEVDCDQFGGIVFTMVYVEIPEAL